MKWYAHLSILGGICVLGAIVVVPTVIGCSEYEQFTSPACKELNTMLGLDLYWISVEAGLVLGLLVAPGAATLYILKAVRRFEKAKSARR
jgi:hypothetical protein